MAIVLNQPTKRITSDRHFARSPGESAKWVLENVHEGDHITVFHNDRQGSREQCIVTNVHNTGTVSARSVGGGRDFQGLVHIENPKLKQDEFVKKNSSFDHTDEHKGVRKVQYAADKALDAVAKLKEMGPGSHASIDQMSTRVDAIEKAVAAINRDLADIGARIAELSSPSPKTKK